MSTNDPEYMKNYQQKKRREEMINSIKEQLPFIERELAKIEKAISKEEQARGTDKKQIFWVIDKAKNEWCKLKIKISYIKYRMIRATIKQEDDINGAAKSAGIDEKLAISCRELHTAHAQTDEAMRDRIDKYVYDFMVKLQSLGADLPRIDITTEQLNEPFTTGKLNFDHVHDTLSVEESYIVAIFLKHFPDISMRSDEKFCAAVKAYYKVKQDAKMPFEQWKPEAERVFRVFEQKYAALAETKKRLELTAETVQQIEGDVE